jgi:mannose-1-phosphate guanylyltransferase
MQNEILKEVTTASLMEGNILLEPSARNTAACIGYAAFEIYKRYGDGIMCVFPSDHYIKDNKEFKNIMEKAISAADSTNKLVTIGIKPTFNSTGYGYIKFETNKKDNMEPVYDVLEFIEKPNLDNAIAFVNSGRYLWNSGMFIWKISVILNSFKRFLPKIYDRLEKIANCTGVEKEEKLKEIYPGIPSISIDYGIMERSDEVLVIPGDFGWSDVGSWDSLGAIYPKDELGNIIKGEHIKIDTKDSIIYGSNRLIATIGLNNIIIVETDDAVLVCSKNKAQDVKLIVDNLKTQGKVKYL